VVNGTIGVLALQGAFQKHIEALHALGRKTQQVRCHEELKRCVALIIPGGESTTMTRLLQAGRLTNSIKTFATKHPVMGTCAGMILMSSATDEKKVEPLHIMDFQVQRNIYGTQRESFTANLNLHIKAEEPPFCGIFIRAPGATKLNRRITVLAEYQERPVLIAQDHHLAASFHPELTADNRIHRYWLSLFDEDAGKESTHFKNYASVAKP